MARLRRLPIHTIRIPVKFTTTTTKAKCRQIAESYLANELARFFEEKNLTMSHATIEEELAARKLRISTPEEWLDGHNLIGYKYTITALL